MAASHQRRRNSRQRRYRAHARMRHQTTRLRPLTGVGADFLIELVAVRAAMVVKRLQF
jgi:hypothetical protein